MIISVQLLRALAAIMVVMHHITIKAGQYHNNALSGFHIGEFGVDLFFIISGYIMCYTTEGKKIVPWVFIQRRIKRIIPLYWVMTAIALAVYLVAPAMVNASGGETSILASWTLFPLGKKLLVNNGWTLSYEFLFYLTFAVCLIAGSAGRRIVLTSLLLIAIFITGLLLQPQHPTAKFLTNGIILEFILGMLAFKMTHNRHLTKLLCALLALSGLLLLIIQNQTGIYHTAAGRVISGGLPMFLFFTGVVGLENDIKQSSVPGIKTCVLIGEASYSLYLIHAFTLSAGAVALKMLRLSHHDVLFTCVLLVSSIIAGLLCWRFIEQPLNACFKRRDNRAVAARLPIS